MKRSPELTDLSRDHHHALVLGRRLVRAAVDEATEASLAGIWQAAKATFSGELEPHFSVEEQLLLPALTAAGETALVAQTLRDHARLRELIGLDSKPKVVREFGELLTRHVRFEERELFPRAEHVLGSAELDAVATASAALEAALIRAEARASRT